MAAMSIGAITGTSFFLDEPKLINQEENLLSCLNILIGRLRFHCDDNNENQNSNFSCAAHFSKHFSVHATQQQREFPNNIIIYSCFISHMYIWWESSPTLDEKKTSNKVMSLCKWHFPCRGILSSLFKIVEIQKFHYHGNITSHFSFSVMNVIIWR